jgi:hypothetical protein
MRRSADWWSDTLDDAKQSGLSIRAYAHAKGLNHNTLAWWKWKLNQPATGRGFVEVELVRPLLQVHADAGVVDVDDDTDLRLLRRVVEALA